MEQLKENVTAFIAVASPYIILMVMAFVGIDWV